MADGFIEYGESIEDAVRRELKDVSLITALRGSENIQLITVQNKGDSDSRQHIITIAYALKLDEKAPRDCAGSDNAETGKQDARWNQLYLLGSETHLLAFVIGALRAWFEKEGKQKRFYVNDVNPCNTAGLRATSRQTRIRTQKFRPGTLDLLAALLTANL
ncbi:hypothetical protein HK101_007547 [Irineochytrium annulatum]|nr:hypothetical protein HK101_007547 [Irineochytrium annulatum]